MRIIGTPSTQARKLNAIASGALPNGDPVVVNADGTVSTISGGSATQSAGSVTLIESATTSHFSATYDANAQKVVIVYQENVGTAIVGTVSGTSISFGSPVSIASANSAFLSVTYDANAQKVVVSYRDNSNSGYGTAAVGTVSGTSISFGSPTVFEAASTNDISTAYDSNAQKVVIAYRDEGNSGYGTVVVGTVSGTSISFGSPVLIDGSLYLSKPSAIYDANSQKIVISYKDNGNSEYGTAIVGTVSGTSISFGTAVVFESAAIGTPFSSAYDDSTQKVVIGYRNNGNSGYGTAIVGTVSGTSISFGTSAVFESASTDRISLSYDPNAQKTAIIYGDVANSRYGTVITGSVSGTSISFDSPLVFENGELDYPSSAYDANAQKVVIAYQDNSNSSYGKAVVFQVGFDTLNLTSENYIGLASNGYPDTATATIDVQGAINDRQSGLTAGQAYYVQTDGTLGTTPADPSVFAGTAISANKIIVKG